MASILSERSCKRLREQAHVLTYLKTSEEVRSAITAAQHSKRDVVLAAVRMNEQDCRSESTLLSAALEAMASVFAAYREDNHAANHHTATHGVPSTDTSSASLLFVLVDFSWDARDALESAVGAAAAHRYLQGGPGMLGVFHGVDAQSGMLQGDINTDLYYTPANDWERRCLALDEGSLRTHRSYKKFWVSELLYPSFRSLLTFVHSHMRHSTFDLERVAAIAEARKASMSSCGGWVRWRT